jgi:mono/diheme cytochrome c family protein
MFKRVVNLIQIGALVCVGVFVVMLFANEPETTSPAGTAEDAPVDGAAVYAANCAVCHGGNGDGGVGPRLGDGAVVQRFPDIEEQRVVVTDGTGRMPAFGSRLSAEEIAAVVDYTRTELGS